MQNTMVISGVLSKLKLLSKLTILGRFATKLVSFIIIIKRSYLKFIYKLGIFIIIFAFLLSYYPTSIIPPRFEPKNIQAQELEQTQTIDSDSIPVGFQLPHPGYLSTRFSSFHPGIDIPTGLGMPVKPIASGVVTKQGYTFGGYGLLIEIDHGHGYVSLYAHLGKVYTKIGQEISENDYIGEVGMTGNTSGPHTHLEIRKDGIAIDPLTILPEMPTLPSTFPVVASNHQSTVPIPTVTYKAPVPSIEPKPTETPKPTPIPNLTPLYPISGTTSAKFDLLSKPLGL